MGHIRLFVNLPSSLPPRRTEVWAEAASVDGKSISFSQTSVDRLQLSMSTSIDTAHSSHGHGSTTQQHTPPRTHTSTAPPITTASQSHVAGAVCKCEMPNNATSTMNPHTAIQHITQDANQQCENIWKAHQLNAEESTYTHATFGTHTGEIEKLKKTIAALRAELKAASNTVHVAPRFSMEIAKHTLYTAHSPTSTNVTPPLDTCLESNLEHSHAVLFFGCHGS